MSVSKRVILWLAIALNAVILSYALISAGGPDAQPLRLSAIPSPEGTVESFFRALSRRDFDAADEYISNYRTLGLYDLPASGTDALSVYIYDHIFDSYALSPVSSDEETVSQSDGQDETDVSASDLWLRETVIKEPDYKITGSRAVADVDYTCLDTGKVAERLTDLLRDIGQRTAGSGIAVDNDEKALELFGESLETLSSENASDYYSSAEIEIELVYTDGMWKLVLTPELYDYICGKFPEEKPAVSGSDAQAAETDGSISEESGNE